MVLSNYGLNKKSTLCFLALDGYQPNRINTLLIRNWKKENSREGKFCISVEDAMGKHSTILPNNACNLKDNNERTVKSRDVSQMS